MPITLRYGRSATLELPLDGAEVEACAAGRGERPADVSRATHEALAAPLEFPQLAQAVVSGDHVTVAVDRLVPAAGYVAAAIVEHLCEAGVPTDAITVLFAEARDAVEPLRIRTSATVPPAGRHNGPVHVEVHDPEDRGKLSFLGNTPSGKSIYLNRAVGDADLVVSVGSSRGGPSWDYRGPYGTIYPTFSDVAARNRFRNPALLHADDAVFLKSQEEVESIGWKSGVQFTVQVVPGAGDEVAAVVAGEVGAVARRVAELHAAEHGCAASGPARTVIAALTGEAAQTWDQLTLALGAVVDLVEDGGVVVLCTELAEPPGPAMELLSQCDDDRDPVVLHIRKQRPVDMFAALQLIEAQRRVRVHLLSRLDPELVENLGMHPIGDPDDVGRLAARGGECVVVADAQRAVVIDGRRG